MTRRIALMLLPLLHVLLMAGCSASAGATMAEPASTAEPTTTAGADSATTGSAGAGGSEPTPVQAEAAASGGEGAAAQASPASPEASNGGPLAAVVVRSGGRGDGEPERLERAENRPAPLLIYTAGLRMMVDGEDIPATIDRVIEEAVRLGGYLASRSDTSVQVRVPSEHFREGLSTFEQLGDVQSRSVSAQDVTEEYNDLEVRLQNLRATRARLEDFLERATNIEEVLRVHAELERIAREIDTVEGRLRFLAARVAFSLVTVTFEPTPVVIVEPEPEPTEPAAPPPPPPAQRPDLPVTWLDQMGLDRLIDFSEED